MGALVRRLEAGERPALEAFLAAAVARGDLLASSAPHGEWLVPFVMLRPDQVAVAEAGGRLVGVVLPDAKAVVVDPAHRRHGIGRALVREGLAITREQGHTELLVGRLPGDERGHDFLRATGFRPHSTLWDLVLDADRDVAPTAWPSDASVRPFDRDRDRDGWVALFNAAFASHPTPLQMDDASAIAGLDDERSRDEDTLLVELGGELAGFCSTDPARGGPEGRLPEVWTMGVRPDLQGRGLGRALLRAGVRYLRGLGAGAIALSVNGRNEGALALYESEGFRRTGTRERWAKRSGPAPG